MMRLPLTVAVVVLVYAWMITLLPAGLQTVARVINAGIIIAMLVWFFRRIDRRLNEVVDIVNNSESSRAFAVDALAKRADVIALAVERQTLDRHTANEVALQAQTERLEAKIEEGTTASRDAQREATAVTTQIAKLDRLILDAMPPKTQVDDIQRTGHESLDILKEGKS